MAQVATSISLSEVTLRAIHKLAESEQRNRSNMIDVLLREALESRENAKAQEAAA